MYTLPLKIIWNGLPVLALALLVLWFSGVFPPPPPPPPTPTITTGPVVLEAIKHVNKQIFIEHYNAVDVHYTEVPSWLGKIGIKQEFVVLIRGRVPAGFDLKQLSEKDIWISSDGQRAQITLPPPIIFEDNVSIDFENSRILAQNDTCPNFICEDNLTAYQNQVLPTGREVLIEFSRNHGILEQAADDGKKYYLELLRSLGFKEVRVVVDGYGS